MLKIYNTLTKEKQEFKPISDKKVNMYTCGVTTYDHCHIGHARSLYVFEVMRKYLNYRGFCVTLVRNITDVDDKIINKANIWAKEQGMSLVDAFNKVRNTYIDSYYQDLSLLELEKADFEPKATENIKEMIEFVEALIKKGFAYEAEGNVYFSVRKLSSYGRLSGKKVDDLISSGRVDNDPLKKEPIDFALWKKAKDNEPFWQSPWGKGRPGWHIECSVMSQKYLKAKTLDIHGGGRDLVFPHHENECAQSEALTGKKFANYWIHHGLITVNKEKMAKSLANFFTIKDVLSKYPADVLKLFFLQAHYSSSIDFSYAKMDEVKKAYESIDILNQKLAKIFAGEKIDKKGDFKEINEIKDKFADSVDDDFNMPKGLAVLFDLVRNINKMIDSKNCAEERLFQFFCLFREICNIFCFTFKKLEETALSDEEIEKKVKLRTKLKKERQFEEADKIRDGLEAQGIILEDSKEATTWRRKL